MLKSFKLNLQPSTFEFLDTGMCITHPFQGHQFRFFAPYRQPVHSGREESKLRIKSLRYPKNPNEIEKDLMVLIKTTATAFEVYHRLESFDLIIHIPSNSGVNYKILDYIDSIHPGLPIHRNKLLKSPMQNCQRDNQQIEKEYRNKPEHKKIEVMDMVDSFIKTNYGELYEAKSILGSYRRYIYETMYFDTSDFLFIELLKKAKKILIIDDTIAEHRSIGEAAYQILKFNKDAEIVGLTLARDYNTRRRNKISVEQTTNNKPINNMNTNTPLTFEETKTLTNESFDLVTKLRNNIEKLPSLQSLLGVNFQFSMIKKEPKKYLPRTKPTKSAGNNKREALAEFINQQTRRFTSRDLITQMMALGTRDMYPEDISKEINYLRFNTTGLIDLEVVDRQKGMIIFQNNKQVIPV